MCAGNTFTPKVFIELLPAVNNVLLLTDKVQKKEIFSLNK